MTLKQKLANLIAQTDLQVSEQQLEQLIAFVEMLNKWNKAYNLTSVRNVEDMLVRHIMDSIIVSPHLKGERFIDVGTGPGLPGIPLAIVNPDKHFVLLDSLGKRTRFQKQVQFELKIDNIEPINSRVEEYQPQELFDGVLSRAFASLSDMLSWCKHLPAKSGEFVALKARLDDEELSATTEIFKITDVIKLDVPSLTEDRHIIKISFINE